MIFHLTHSSCNLMNIVPCLPFSPRIFLIFIEDDDDDDDIALY